MKARIDYAPCRTENLQAAEGATLEQTIRDCSYVSKRLNCLIFCKFQGFTLTVTPMNDPTELIAHYFGTISQAIEKRILHRKNKSRKLKLVMREAVNAR